MRSEIEYLNQLPELSENSQNILLIYDSIFEKKSEVKVWLKKFKFKVAVQSGESLKTLREFNRTLHGISKLEISRSANLTFVALGGGTVCDHVGFLASVFLRGRKLILIPSTWLAAADSAHGGKNGLNFAGAKNQIGTFYLPEKIIIVKSLLNLQPPERLTESMGELIKIAVLNDELLFTKLEPQISIEDAFQILPAAINDKYKIVEQDPLESNGTRRLLNLGHTLGHVFESEFKISHGIAVLLGLEFAAAWSFHLKLLSETDYMCILNKVKSFNLEAPLKWYLQRMSDLRIKRRLKNDKKITVQDKMDFIFIKSICQCERKSVAIGAILEEANRQRNEN